MTDTVVTKDQIMALQRALVAYGYADEIDGRFGKNSYDAAQRAGANLPPFDDKKVVLPFDLMVRLGILSAPHPKPKGLNIVQASILDYVLNFAQSKIVWAAGLLVAAVVSFISTKWGLTIDTNTQQTIIGWLVAGGGALIAVLRTFFNAPKVATKQPEIVTKP